MNTFHLGFANNPNDRAVSWAVEFSAIGQSRVFDDFLKS